MTGPLIPNMESLRFFPHKDGDIRGIVVVCPHCLWAARVRNAPLRPDHCLNCEARGVHQKFVEFHGGVQFDASQD